MNTEGLVNLYKVCIFVFQKMKKMMNQTYNHDIFIEKLFEMGSKQAQFQTLKTYMLSLTIEEFDEFFFGNLTKIKQGIMELSESGELTTDDRLDFLKSFDDLITRIKAMQQSSVTTSA